MLSKKNNDKEDEEFIGIQLRESYVTCKIPKIFVVGMQKL